MDQDRVRPVPTTVEIGGVTGVALDIIRRENLDYLPVVAEQTGKLVGVVMRKGEDDPLDEQALQKANREPIVVVDRDLKPLAIVQGEGEE